MVCECLTHLRSLVEYLSMVLLHRLIWLRGQATAGRPMGVHFSYNASTCMDKIKFRLAILDNSATAAFTSSMLVRLPLLILSRLQLRVMLLLIVDIISQTDQWKSSFRYVEPQW